MIGYIVDIEFNWGICSRFVGLSKSSFSYLYPPPTSFLGAIASVLAKNNNFGEKEGVKVINSLLSITKALGFRPLNFIPISFEDLNRIITIKITSGKLYPDPYGISSSFDAVSKGKTVYISLDENPPTLRWFWIITKDGFEVNGKKLKVEKDILYEINRIGGRESVVNVYNVKKIEGIEISEEHKTNYSYPLINGIGIIREFYSQNWCIENYINIFDDNIKKNLYMSISPINIHVEAKNKYILSLIPYKVPVCSIDFEKPYTIVSISNTNFAIYKYKEEYLVGKNDNNKTL